MTGTPSPRRLISRKLKEHNDNIAQLWRLGSTRTGSSLPTGRTLGSGRSSVPVSSDVFVRRNGDTWGGAMGEIPYTVIIDDNAIDIAPEDNINLGLAMPTVFLQPENGTTDNLVRIEGVKQPQQGLWARGVNSTVTISLIDSASTQTAWVTSTAYALGDIISHNSLVYSCKQAHTSAATNEPGVGATWQDFWWAGNISTSDGNNFDIEGKRYYRLVYDSADERWVITSSLGTGGGSSSFPLDYSVDRQGNSSGTVTHDLTATTAHKLQFTATADCDITLSNIPTSAADAVDFYIQVEQDSTGGHDITFNDSEVINPPTLSTTADTVSLLACHADGDGNVRVITLLNASPSSGTAAWSSFPAIQAVNMANFSFTNYVGYTSGVGQSMDVGSSGNTWNLPSGDSYIFRVNGVEQFSIQENSMNVHSHSFTNYVGYTGLVGQAVTVDGTGVINDLPTGDQYNWRINGSSIFTIGSTGLGITGDVTLGEGYIHFDDTPKPASPGLGGRRLYVSSTTGETSVVDSSGNEISLETGATEFTDSLFRIEDNLDDTRKLAFQTGGITTGNTRTWTAQNASGTVALLDSGNTQTFSDDIIPNSNGVRDWGSSSNHLNQLFTEQITLRSISGPATNTTAYITADSANMIANVPSGDEYVWKIGGTTFMQWSEDSNNRLFIRSGAAKEIGFVVSASNVTVGTSGTMEMPVDSGSVGSASAADTDFGDNVGCFGVYLNNGGNPSFVIKIDDSPNTWASLTIPSSGSATGGRLT